MKTVYCIFYADSAGKVNHCETNSLPVYTPRILVADHTPHLGAFDIEPGEKLRLLPWVAWDSILNEPYFLPETPVEIREGIHNLRAR